MDTLLRRMPRSLLYEWLAYFELEPFGPARADLRAGVIGAAVLNSAFGRKRGARVIQPSDLFENLKPPAKRQTAQQMSDAAKNLTRMFGGLVLKKGERPPKGKAKGGARGEVKGGARGEVRDKDRGKAKGKKPPKNRNRR